MPFTGQQTTLEEDETILVPAELAMLEWLEGHPATRPCADDCGKTLHLKLGELSDGIKRVPAAVWECTATSDGEPHFRREVPVRFMAQASVGTKSVEVNAGAEVDF